MKGIKDYTSTLAHITTHVAPYVKKNVLPFLGDAPTFQYSRQIIHHLRHFISQKDGEVYYDGMPFSGTTPTTGGNDDDADLLAPLMGPASGDPATPAPHTPTVIYTTLHDSAYVTPERSDPSRAGRTVTV